MNGVDIASDDWPSLPVLARRQVCVFSHATVFIWNAVKSRRRCRPFWGVAKESWASCTDIYEQGSEHVTSASSGAAPGAQRPEPAVDVVDADLVPGPADSASVPGPGNPGFDYTDSGVPTLEYVRDKVEGRLSTAQGSRELADEADAARAHAQKQQDRERAAADKLAEIRKSIGH